MRPLINELKDRKKNPHKHYSTLHNKQIEPFVVVEKCMHFPSFF